MDRLGDAPPVDEMTGTHMNVFYSERLRGEMALDAARPSDVPVASPQSVADATAYGR